MYDPERDLTNPYLSGEQRILGEEARRIKAQQESNAAFHRAIERRNQENSSTKRSANRLNSTYAYSDAQRHRQKAVASAAGMLALGLVLGTAKLLYSTRKPKDPANPTPSSDIRKDPTTSKKFGLNIRLALIFALSWIVLASILRATVGTGGAGVVIGGGLMAAFVTWLILRREITLGKHL